MSIRQSSAAARLYTAEQGGNATWLFNMQDCLYTSNIKLCTQYIYLYIHVIYACNYNCPIALPIREQKSNIDHMCFRWKNDDPFCVALLIIRSSISCVCVKTGGEPRSKVYSLYSVCRGRYSRGGNCRRWRKEKRKRGNKRGTRYRVSHYFKWLERQPGACICAPYITTCHSAL